MMIDVQVFGRKQGLGGGGLPLKNLLVKKITY